MPTPIEVSEATIRAKLKTPEADFVLGWLRERHDVALFFGLNANIGKKVRLLVCTRQPRTLPLPPHRTLRA